MPGVLRRLSSIQVLIPLGSVDGSAPHGRAPVATGVLIAANCLVYLVWRLLPAEQGLRLLYVAGATPFDVTHLTSPLAPVTVVSSMFLHGGVVHLIGNIWFLWVFGQSVEAVMGTARFFLFYATVGVLAAFSQVLLTPESRVPMVGASGAIAGVLGGYFLLFPRARVQLIVFLVFVIQVVVVPAFVALGVWFLWQLISARAASVSSPTVAFGAHLAGFLLGVALSKLFARPWTDPVVASSSSPP